MAATQGLKVLEAAVIAVTLHPYDYDPSADAVGLAAGLGAARALELASGLTLKTLMVEVDGRPVGIAQAMAMAQAMAVLGARAAALIA